MKVGTGQFKATSPDLTLIVLYIGKSTKMALNWEFKFVRLKHPRFR